MAIPTPRALVFMTGRNCAPYVGDAITSLAQQTHGALQVLFVDDASDDATGEIAKRLLGELFAGRHRYVRNATPFGKARNAHVHLRAALGEGDFVAVLDADDQLAIPSALAQMASRYASGCDVVWTNFVTDGGGVGRNGPLDPLASPRGQGWKTSHFFSFRAELLANVPVEYFQDAHGEWLQAACDFAIAYPVLDQTRRYSFLPIQAYRYTARNPASHHNRDPQAQGLNSRAQRYSAEQVLAKPALPCTRFALGDHPGGDQVLAQLRDRLVREVQALQAEVQKLGTQTAAAPAAVSMASALAASDGWTTTAATELARRCPALVDLALDGQQAEPLGVQRAWQLWRWLAAGPKAPRVLEIGAGALSAPLLAMVQAMGGQATSVTAHRERAQALYARLHACGLEADVIHVPMADAGLEGLDGQFPDLNALSEELRDFDIAFVSAAEAGGAPSHALVSLPMAAPRLGAEGFRFCLWAPEAHDLRQAAAASWRRLADDLVYSDGALGGAALCVTPA